MKMVGCRSAAWPEACRGEAFALRGGRAFALLFVCVAAVSAQPLKLIPVRPIEAPDRPLPPEAASAGVTRFSFIAYGDTRGQADGREIEADHSLVVDAMLAKITSLASTPFPVRFIVNSGDAVERGRDGAAWNVSYS